MACKFEVIIYVKYYLQQFKRMTYVLLPFSCETFVAQHSRSSRPSFFFLDLMVDEIQSDEIQARSYGSREHNKNTKSLSKGLNIYGMVISEPIEATD